MKKFKNLFLVAAVALFGFSSCMTSGDDLVGTGYGNVTMRIALNSPSTLSVGPSQGATPVTITSGYVIFTIGERGTIQHYFRLGQDGVTLAALQAGHTFANVSALATYVHFIGNTEIEADMVEGATSISVVLDQILDVPSQVNDLVGGNQVVNVYRVARIQPGTPRTANLEVEPTVARVELRRITGDRTIAGFTVQGVFMDRYFPTAYLDGRLRPVPADLQFRDTPTGLSPTLIRARGTTACVGLFNWPSTPVGNIPAFTSDLLGPVFDWRADATPNQWQAVNIGDPYEDMFTYPAGAQLGNRHRQSIQPHPTQPYVWGYNLFANYTTTERDPALGGLGSQFPMIIVRMTNVMIRYSIRCEDTDQHLGYDIRLHPEHNGVATTPLFVTIRGFVPNVGHGAGQPLCPYTGFRPRRVYQIGATDGGWFGKDVVRPVPNEQPVYVEVTILPMPWIIITGQPTP